MSADITRDGRTARSAHTRAAILAACRRLMVAGTFRPSISAVAESARCSVRSVFTHFETIDGLHRLALDHISVRAAIAASVLGAAADLPIVSMADRVAFAAVFGHAPESAT